MPRDLETLKDKLWETFEDATARHSAYEDGRSSGSGTPFNPKTENRKAIADLAQAILAVEAQITVKELIEEARKDRYQTQTTGAIMAKTKTLEEMREALGTAFDLAVKNFDSISDYEGNSLSRGTARADALQAMAQIADSVTAMEAQIGFQKLVEKAEKDGAQIVIEVSQGLSKDMKLPGAIKLKQPGQ
jgi:uncharacterized protein YicC (UPF0701 family)